MRFKKILSFGSKMHIAGAKGKYYSQPSMKEEGF
jgi:hypothetical protein